MAPSKPAAHQRLAVEAELAAEPCRFVRERLRLPMGIEASFGWLRHPPSVLVLPQREDGQVLLLRRYRPAVGRWVLEFPGGPLEPNETAAAGAARWLRQLSGHGSRGWQELGSLHPNPGYSDELLTLGRLTVTAKENGSLPPPREPEVGDSLSLELWSLEALETTLASPDEIVDGRSVSAWFLAQQRGVL